MIKRVGAILLCIFLITSSLVIVFPVEALKVNGNTLYVGGSGPGNYTKIQDAIDAANSGDTVFVYSGIFYENVVINKSINLMGNDRNSTIIDSYGGNVLTIFADFVYISGFTIQNGEQWGIWIENSKNPIIMNNIIRNFYRGILVLSSTNVNIIGNIIYGNDDTGISIDYTFYSMITSNTIAENGIGIQVFESSYNNITGNIITKNHYCGIQHFYSSNNLIKGNTIKESQCGIAIDDGSKNIITQNNFISNIGHAYFGHMRRWVPLIFLHKHYWNNNYWDDWKTTDPRPIKGEWYVLFGFIVGIGIGPVPYWQFDWHPAQEPYDIPIPDLP